MKLIFLFVIVFPIFSFAKLQIATTTTDLASLVKKVGHEQVDVFAIAKGTQDPHQIEAKPSFMMKLRTTDLVIAHGLELESAWIVPLIQGARNSKLTTKDGLFELAGNLDPIEIPKGEVSRSDGDVHPGGNPHFQLDPIRLGKAAQLIARKLGDMDVSQKDFFIKNANSFEKEMLNKTKLWNDRVKKSGIIEVVTYHKTFSYFCDRFNIRCLIQLEPKPGIPPTTSHLLTVIDQMKQRKINLVLIENLFEDSVSQKLKADLPNIIVKKVPISVEGESNILTNEDLIENLVKVVEEGGH